MGARRWTRPSRPGAAPPRAGALEQGKARRLAQRQAAPRGIEGTTGLGADQLQRIEAVQHAVAQAVHAAHHGGVDHTEADQPLGLGEHLGAGGAGRGHGAHRSAQIEQGLHEGDERVRRMQYAVDQTGREAPIGIAPAVGLFGGADAGRGGAQHQGHALAAMARDGVLRGGEEIVPLQAEPGGAVVAAVPGGEARRQRRRLDRGDAPDPAGQRLRAEVVRAQAAAARLQCLQQRRTAQPRGTGDGVGGDGQGAMRDSRRGEAWAGREYSPPAQPSGAATAPVILATLYAFPHPTFTRSDPCRATASWCCACFPCCCC